MFAFANSLDKILLYVSSEFFDDEYRDVPSSNNPTDIDERLIILPYLFLTIFFATSLIILICEITLVSKTLVTSSLSLRIDGNDAGIKAALLIK